MEEQPVTPTVGQVVKDLQMLRGYNGISLRKVQRTRHVRGLPVVDDQMDLTRVERDAATIHALRCAIDTRSEQSRPFQILDAAFNFGEANPLLYHERCVQLMPDLGIKSVTTLEKLISETFDDFAVDLLGYSKSPCRRPAPFRPSAGERSDLEARIVALEAAINGLLSFRAVNYQRAQMCAGLLELIPRGLAVLDELYPDFLNVVEKCVWILRTRLNTQMVDLARRNYEIRFTPGLGNKIENDLDAHLTDEEFHRLLQRLNPDDRSGEDAFTRRTRNNKFRLTVAEAKRRTARRLASLLAFTEHRDGLSFDSWRNVLTEDDDPGRPLSLAAV